MTRSRPQAQDRNLANLIDAPDFDEAEFVALAALWSDQGMAHLVEVYEKGSDGTTPAALVLVDFGTETMFKSRVLKAAQAAPAVDYVIARLQDQVNGGQTPKLDYVVISHQDTDHWSLLNYLVDSVETQDWAEHFKVGKICRGGSDWGQSAKAALSRLAAYVADTDTDYVPWTKNETNYDNPDGDPGQVFNLGDVYFRLLTVNAPVSSKGMDLKKNGTSAVVVLDYKGVKSVLPGDATWETLKDANKYLKKWAKKEKTPMQPCFVLSVPHHGSLRTIVPNHKATELDFAIVRAFTEYLKPNSTVASAGIKNGFKHPYLEVLLEFSKYVETDFNLMHDIVFFSNENQDWGSLVLAGKVFTTQLTLTLPIQVADWRFALNNDGQTFITPYIFDGVTKEYLAKKAEEESEMDTGDIFPMSRELAVEIAGMRVETAKVDSPVRRVTARPGAGAP